MYQRLENVFHAVWARGNVFEAIDRRFTNGAAIHRHCEEEVQKNCTSDILQLQL